MDLSQQTLRVIFSFLTCIDILFSLVFYSTLSLSLGKTLHIRTLIYDLQILCCSCLQDGSCGAVCWSLLENRKTSSLLRLVCPQSNYISICWKWGVDISPSERWSEKYELCILLLTEIFQGDIISNMLKVQIQ